MTRTQIALVQQTWKEVAVLGDAAAQLFYARLFALDPSLASMFRGDMVEQGRKLVAMIGVAVNGLARIETLLPVIEALGRRHAGYGVQDHHYAIVAEALLGTLERGLGKGFTPEVKQAWTAAYGILASTMQGAAQAKAA